MLTKQRQACSWPNFSWSWIIWVVQGLTGKFTHSLFQMHLITESIS